MGYFSQKKSDKRRYNTRSYQGVTSTSVGGQSITVAGERNNLHLVNNDYYTQSTVNNESTIQKTFAPQITIAGEGADVSQSQTMPTLGGLDSYTWIIVMAGLVFLAWTWIRHKR